MAFLSEASSHLSSHRTVSSIRMILFSSDHMTMSGLRYVFLGEGGFFLIPLSFLAIHVSVSLSWIRCFCQWGRYHTISLGIGFSSVDGITSPWTWSWNLLVTVPCLITTLLDFLGLNFILAHVAMSSSAFRIHLACTWDEVVTFPVAVMRSFIPRINQDGGDSATHYDSLFQVLPLDCEMDSLEP